MKYVIKWETELGTTHYLQAIPAALRKYRGRLEGHIVHTQSLTKALLYPSWEAASAVIVYVHRSHCPGRIYGVSDKELFTARLKCQ